MPRPSPAWPAAFGPQYQQFITPKSFDYLKTTDILVMLYLGGMGSLSGSILGVVFYTVTMELLRNLLGMIAPQLADLRMPLKPAHPDHHHANPSVRAHGEPGMALAPAQKGRKPPFETGA